MKSMPLVSVIMGIYNCGSTLGDAIDSLLSQTYTNWELIMCDDGSKDNTYEVADTYKRKYPNRILLLKHEINMGLNKTLNDCLAEATGEFIARMDGDDISLPTRFEKEMEVFEHEPQLAVVSCPMIYFDDNGEWGRGNSIGREYPAKEWLVKGTIHCHAPAIIRKKVMLEVGGYTVDPKLLRVEDWHLWIKIYAAGYKGKNLNEPLYRVRDDHNALKRKKFSTSLNEAYVSLLALKQLNLSYWRAVFSLRPLIVGILPSAIYSFLHRYKIRLSTLNQ